MKNAHSLLLLLLFCLPYSAIAQFQYGVKTGVNLGYAILKFSEISPSSGLTRNKWKRIPKNWPSPLLGMYANLAVSTHFSLHMELFGLHRTWRSDLQFFSRVEQMELTYLCLPMLVLFRPAEEKWGIELGPELSYLLIRRNISPSKLIQIEPARIEAGISVGFKYFLKKWALGLRFTNDLTPFFRNNPRSTSRFDHRLAHYYHRGYQLSIAHPL